MNTLMAIVIGGVYAAALFLLLRRHIVKMMIGFALLNHASNLLIFTAAKLSRGAPPIIPQTGELVGDVADPVPQALILTAIVISFGVLSFTMVLINRVYQSVGSEDIDDMRIAES